MKALCAHEVGYKQSLLVGSLHVFLLNEGVGDSKVEFGGSDSGNCHCQD